MVYNKIYNLITIKKLEYYELRNHKNYQSINLDLSQNLQFVFDMI